MIKNLTAIAVIDRTPSEQEAKALAFDLLQKERPGSPDDPRLDIQWFTSEELPPIEATGMLLPEYDQLEAHHRDVAGSVYLVVTVDGNR